MNASDVLIETIQAWGVDTIFGLPGDGINGIVEALRKRKDKIRFIQVRHEEAAAFMACAYAKHTGKLGCCLATSGPGGIHLLNGLYDAKLDGQPVLAITGMQFHDLTDTHTQQDVELDKLFENVCVYNTRCMGPAHLENIAELACRAALVYRGVSHLCIPVDFQELEVKTKGSGRNPRNVSHHVSDVAAESARLPSDDDLRKAAEILNAGKRIAILAGRGALSASSELQQTAAKLSAPIVKALLGKAAVPDDSPYTTGGIGLLGTLPSQEVMEDCDTLLIVGSSFPYIEFLPEPGQARAVQIDLDPLRIGLRYPVEVGLVGDCRRSLEKLLPLLRTNEKRSFLKQAQAGMKDWNKRMDAQAAATSKPMKPQRLAAELGKRLPADAIINCDSGTIATWWARHIPARNGQMHTVSGNLATMACGLPYTIASQIAYPDRLCVGFVGDGGFSMLMAEFVTAVRYRLPIKIVIVKNNSLGQIRWEQMVFLGNPEYECDLTPIHFADFARACGGVGFTIEDPNECGEILDRALGTPGPVVVEASVDPNEPPMPPKVTAKQAARFAESLARGTPDRRKILETVLQNKVRELL
ncbi:MAG TPA: thiamine pyrophosphate-dependent enzyme [Bryobacteraceae bacterium]|jgi:pyruvate dehydrogenase (quinone)|nr:thiamine pyrophosphate-dependent enzyme [Bryobacteraceae bacterium]